jgi:hypothetical protein
MNKFQFLSLGLLIISIVLLLNGSTVYQSYADSTEDQYQILISDNVFLHSASVLSFDIQAFLNTMPGPLKNYSEEINDRSWSAMEIIDYNAFNYGVNPQLILVLLESQNALLTDPNASVPKTLHPDLQLHQPSFYSYVKQNTESLFEAYYGRLYGEHSGLIVFSGGEPVTLPGDINAGTYAVLVTLAAYVPQSEWNKWTMGEDPLFIQKYTQWFGDPHHGFDLAGTQSPLPTGYILPFDLGSTWYLTSGPHNYIGGVVGCTSGSGCPRPWSSIDIAPPEVIECPGGGYPPDRWIVAAKGGTVIDSSQARVVIDHGDGWRTYYSHVATNNRIEEGPVNQGDRIGHPSCEVEPGGSSSGVHVHFAIWQEGSGFVDIDGSTLSNWEVEETTHYNGKMNRNGAIRVADTRRLIGTNDLLNSIVLFSDTFSDGNMDGWTIVDAPGANSAPSAWSVIYAKGSYVLRQNSNIHRQNPPLEGTYAYTGQSWWTDYYLNVDIEPDDNDGLIVIFRYVDDGNYYRFFMDRERHYRRLEKKVDGAYTTLAEDLSTGYGTDGWLNVQIILSNTTIKVLLDYSPIFDVNDDSHSSGGIGVGTWASTGAHFDNIIVATSGVDPYADAVVDANIKGGGNGHSDPAQALGRPRHNKDYDYVSIGGPGYWLVVDMGEGEEIYNGPGNDFRVYEIGRASGGVDEEYDVSVSNSPTGPWVYIGQGWTTSEFDLAGSGLQSARYVRIDDLSTRTGDPHPGSDIDAVQSLNMVGDLIIEAPGSLSKEVSGNNVVLNWNSVGRAEGYNVYTSRIGSGAGFSLLAYVPSVSVNNYTNSTENNNVSYVHLNAASSEFYYVVTAVSPEGFESSFSLEVPYRLFIPIISRN